MHRFSLFLLWAGAISKSCDAFTLHPPGFGTGRSTFVFASAAKPNPLHRRHSNINISRLHSTNTNGSGPGSGSGSTEKNQGDQEEEKEREDEQSIQDKFSYFVEMALPYYEESSAGRWLFAGMLGMTVLNSGVSVAFSYVGKDFWNALNSKDTEQFYILLWRYAGALLIGSPVSVLYTFQRERLA